MRTRKKIWTKKKSF